MINMKKGQAYDTFKVMIAAVVAVAILGILLSIIGGISDDEVEEERLVAKCERECVRFAVDMFEIGETLPDGCTLQNMTLEDNTTTEYVSCNGTDVSCIGYELFWRACKRYSYESYDCDRTFYSAVFDLEFNEFYPCMYEGQTMSEKELGELIQLYKTSTTTPSLNNIVKHEPIIPFESNATRNFLTFESYKEQMKNVKFGEYRKVKETTQLTEITPEIRALASELRVEDNVIGTISLIEVWIWDNIEYQEDCTDNMGDYWARSQAVLERKYGCCHHMAILAMSLLRANGLYAGYLYEDLEGIYDHVQPIVLLPEGEEVSFYILFGESPTNFNGTLNRTNYLKVF